MWKAGERLKLFNKDRIFINVNYVIHAFQNYANNIAFCVSVKRGECEEHKKLKNVITITYNVLIMYQVLFYIYIFINLLRIN